MSQLATRDEIVERLRIDLIGPGAAEEEIRDRPTDRYFTGILYPLSTPNSPEEDETIAGAVDGDEDDVEEEAIPLVSTLKPSSMGLSFAVTATSKTPSLRFEVRCGTYSTKQLPKDDAETPAGPERERRSFVRKGHHVERTVPLQLGGTQHEVDAEALKGLVLHVQTAPWGEAGRYLVTAALVNRNQTAPTRDESEEATFYQVHLRVEGGPATELVARPAERAEVDEDDRAAGLIYRDAHELAAGHTCAAEWGTEGGKAFVSTTWLPLTTVPAVSDGGDRELERLRAVDGLLPLSAAWLAQAPPADLSKALALVVDCYDEWITRTESTISSLAPHHAAQARLHMEVCRAGAMRMRAGVTLVESDEAVRTAFQLAQRAMATQRMWMWGEQLVWRPFQLAFQLLTLRSTAERGDDSRGVMDLLWFPTGGGKTEAYLGITAFLLFLRRLRKTEADDGAGVAVIMRYTLRLLTVQQFQRATTVITVCEHLRRLAARGEAGLPDLGTAAFSIGLWVGNSTTPGTLKDARAPGAGSTATHKQLSECPCCHGPLEWAPIREKMAVNCAAKNGKCELAETSPAIPIWTIDEDVYRERPSLVIGTVDKFAQIVRKLETRSLFGLGSTAAPPDLIIQDELHLISGPLGTMTGLYETAIDELCAHGGIRPKIIGSTATIRRAAAQIRALFNRDTYQFPPPGVDASSSGFAVTDPSRPGRQYLGVTTAGRSAKFAVQAVSAALLQTAAHVGTSDADRDPYWTFVGYFNTLRELGGSLVLMQDDVPISMRQIAARRGEIPRAIAPPAELTSRVSSDEIRDMLQQLGKKLGDAEAIDVLVASNMISVGVDIPRLGLMMMVGQPKTISEYIQATSRVGRGTTPGLV
ncbi:MAG: DEAD/DEAH box helicase, partial [Myxococcales bacterium]|nr:DEAD/DEAH box helicase [Myxococcales bacterium]